MKTIDDLLQRNSAIMTQLQLLEDQLKQDQKTEVANIFKNYLNNIMNMCHVYFIEHMLKMCHVYLLSTSKIQKYIRNWLPL